MGSAIECGTGTVAEMAGGPRQYVTETKYEALLAVLQDSLNLEQIAKESEACQAHVSSHWLKPGAAPL